jgi:hypothetical protein
MATCSRVPVCCQSPLHTRKRVGEVFESRVPANGAIGERQTTLPTGSEHLQPHRIVLSIPRVSWAGCQIRSPSPTRTQHAIASRRTKPAVGGRRGGSAEPIKRISPQVCHQISRSGGGQGAVTTSRAPAYLQKVSTSQNKSVPSTETERENSS